MKTAQQYLGYTSELLGRTVFGQKVGYDSTPWSGAFVDVVAREAGVQMPAFTYTPSALAEFVRSGDFSREPRPGSIAIYNFSSNIGNSTPFSMPHCGIVIDVREFSETGKFITVEGNITGAGPHQQKDGVHQRIRTINEALIFCHPVFDGRAGSRTFNERLIQLLDRGRTKFNGEDVSAIQDAARDPQLLTIDKEIRPGDRNRKIEIIQLALATVTDLRGVQPGKWDQVTAAACSRYQRNIGRVGKDVTGLPDKATLLRLSKDTGLFVLDNGSTIP
jgi:hypothetical protein